MTHLTKLADMLTSLARAYCDSVPVQAVSNLITEEIPPAVAQRLRDLARDYPSGIPSELVGIESRRARALAFMVTEGLIDHS